MPKMYNIHPDGEIPLISSIAALMRILWKLDVKSAGNLWDQDGISFMVRTYERRVREKNKEKNSTSPQQGPQ